MKALEDTVEKLNADLLKNAAATKATGKAAATATGNIQRMGIAFRTTLGPIVGLYGAFNFLNKSLQVASDRQVNIAKLTNGLKNLGATQSDLENLVDAADRFGKATLFDQEDATNAFALLTSFQRIGVESYERVTKAASDLATVTGQDLKSAQIQLAKALEDPAKRVSDLARSGTVFTDQQKEQIKVLQESGQLFEAQNLILQEIEKQYGGAAEAAGSAGLAGALDTLGEVTRDFQEVLVSSTGSINLAEEAVLLLAGQIEKLTGSVKDIQGIIQALDTLVRNATGGFIGFGDAIEYIVDNAYKAIPGLDGLVILFNKAAEAAARFNDAQAGTRNFGSNYAAEERKLFEAAGGWTPYKPKPTPGLPPRPTTGGSGSRGKSAADRAAEAAAKEAERIAEKTRKQEQFLERLEQQLKIEQQINDLDRATEELNLDLLEIEQRYINEIQGETDALILSNAERKKALEMDIARSKAMQGMMDIAGNEFAAWFKLQPEAKLLNDELTQTEELMKGAFDIVANSLTSSMAGLIDGTKEWKDVLSDILGQLGQMALQFGFSVLSKGLFPGFANGGAPPMGQPSIVGERGPELFIPNQSGRIVSNEAMGNYMPSNSSSSSSGPVSINYNGPTLNFNGDDYIPRSEAPKLVEQGAKMGEQRTMNHLRNNRSSRQRIGI